MSEPTQSRKIAAISDCSNSWELGTDARARDIAVPSNTQEKKKNRLRARFFRGQTIMMEESSGMSTIIVFTVNVLTGLVISQVASILVPHQPYKVWYEVVRVSTMWCLAFIMINVGHEFVIDTTNMRQYGVDYLIAMTAAGFPWLFVAAWFMWVLPNPLPWDESLLAARFAAPTSAGVLFCMLEAAGLKETWLFKKARILAIFDDLDTILLMIPLKAVLAGFKWEVGITLAIVVALVVLAYKRLHRYLIPLGWKWTLFYALLVTAVTEVVYYVTKKHIEMEAVHIEVLLPAFVLGAIVREHDHEHDVDAADTTCLAASKAESDKANGIISAVFMVLVGLSMPGFLNNDDDESGGMGPGDYVFHVAMISILMVLGKMFPLFCYRNEADLYTRLALALGMCPRGEVGAGVIVVSLALGVKGDAVPVAICSLALNIALSGFFILATTKLVNRSPPKLRRRNSHLFDEMSEPTQSRKIAAISDCTNSEELNDKTQGISEPGHSEDTDPGRIKDSANEAACTSNHCTHCGAPISSETGEYIWSKEHDKENKRLEGNDIDDIAIQIVNDVDDIAVRLQRAEEEDSTMVLTVSPI